MNPKSKKPSSIPQRRLFLSCVTHEFRVYRDVLAANLAQPGVELRRQEDFVNTGGTTLEKLNNYIQTCDAVIHLVGYGTGAYPEPAAVAGLLAALPDFASKLGLEELLAPPGLSYTQWEAWLAIYHNKPLALYHAGETAQREPAFVKQPAQMERQSLHWERLKDLGRDRKEFISPHDLSIEVLRALPLMVPGFAENVRHGEFRDRNLLFAVLALQDEILTRENFIRICTLWGGDTEQSVAELMEHEGLLSTEDRQLIETRIERKLKKQDGNIRDSLAQNIDGNIRQTLGHSLDATTLASLPDSLAAMQGLTALSGTWRYRLTRTHGQGGLGVVSVAEDTSLERSVAVKRLRTERMLDPMAIERFVREARITGRLQHPNIVPVYELGLVPEDQVPFYSMRFVGHRTLLDAIKQHYADKTSSESVRNIRFREIIQSYLAVCNAVAFAHDQGVIHRDLKPENVMIGDFGEVILLDWGLAKRMDEAELPAPKQIERTDNSSKPVTQTMGGARLGSPAYMSPEQAAGLVEAHGTHTDIYGLGVVLYEILTCDVPFTGASTEELLTAIQTRPVRNPREVNALCPAPLAAICCKAMEKEPKNRYASAKEIATDIQHWLADEPVSVLAESRIVRLQRVIRKNPGPASAIAASIVVGLLGLTLGFYFVSKSNQLAARRLDEKRLALDQMLQTFGDDKLKGSPGSQPIRKLFLEKGLIQYQGLLAEQAGNPTVILRTGNAYRELGLVTKELGDSDESITNLNRAMDLCRTAVAVRPKDPAMKAALGDSLYELGQAFYELQKYDQAKPFVEESVETFNSLLSVDPTNLDYKAKLGRGLVRNAALLDKDQTAQNAFIDQAIPLLREAVKGFPNNPDYMLYLARAVNNRATRFALTNTECLQSFQEAESLLSKALKISPALPLGNSLHAFFSRNVSKSLTAMGRTTNAMDFVDRVLMSLREAVEENPAVLSGNIALVDLLNEKAHLSEILGRPDDAIKTYEEIVQRNDALSQLNPRNATAYVLASVTATSDIASAHLRAKRQAEGSIVYDRITKKSHQLMEQHPDSTKLLTTLINAHTSQSELLRQANRLDQATTGYKAAVDLYQAFAPRVPMVEESCLADYITCAGGLIKITKEQNGLPPAILLSEKLILPIGLNQLTNSDHQQGLLVQQVDLAHMYSDVDRDREAIDLMNKIVNDANVALAGDRTSNWYLYQMVFGSYHHRAIVYRKLHDERNQYLMLRQYFAETMPYVDGIKNKDLLDKTTEFSTENLALLWKEHEAIFDKHDMKLMTIQVDFDGIKYPFGVYIAESWPFLFDQFTWLKRVRGGVVPQETVDNFAKLYKIATAQKVSFSELCVYKMGPARSDQEDPFKDAPMLTEKPMENIKSGEYLRELAILKSKFRDSGATGAARRDLALRYVQLAETEVVHQDAFRAGSFLDNAFGYLTTDSPDQLRNPTDADLFHYAKYVQSALFASQGKLDEAYKTATGNLRNRPTNAAPEFVPAIGGQEFVLGWISRRRENPIEACVWYQRSSDLGNKFAARNLTRLYLESPEIRPAISDTMKLQILKSAEIYATDLYKFILAGLTTNLNGQQIYNLARAGAFYVSLLDAFENPATGTSEMRAPMAGLAIIGAGESIASGQKSFEELNSDPDLKVLIERADFRALKNQLRPEDKWTPISFYKKFMGIWLDVTLVSVKKSEALYSKDQNSTNRLKLATAYNTAADRALYSQRWSDSENWARKSIELNPSPNPIAYGNLATALLFQEKYDDALLIYRAHWKDAVNGITFGEATLSDFESLERLGIINPGTARIRAEFTTPSKSPVTPRNAGKE